MTPEPHKWPADSPAGFLAVLRLSRVKTHQRRLGGLLVRSLPEKEVESSTSTQAERVFETFRLRLAQRDKHTFFDFSELPLRERMSSEIGNQPINFSIRDIASQLR
jgi:hypothetical protein